MKPARPSRRAPRGDRGAAAVELALVLPLFLLLIFGLIQYGWYFYQLQETAFALREGARVAAVTTTDDEGICEVVGGRMTTASTSTVAVSTSGDQVGDRITVTAKRAATDFNFPLIPFPESLNQISSEADTRIENINETNLDSYQGTTLTYSSGSCS